MEGRQGFAREGSWPHGTGHNAARHLIRHALDFGRRWGVRNADKLSPRRSKEFLKLRTRRNTTTRICCPHEDQVNPPSRVIRSDRRCGPGSRMAAVRGDQDHEGTILAISPSKRAAVKEFRRTPRLARDLHPFWRAGNRARGHLHRHRRVAREPAPRDRREGSDPHLPERGQLPPQCPEPAVGILQAVHPAVGGGLVRLTGPFEIVFYIQE